MNIAQEVVKLLLTRTFCLIAALVYHLAIGNETYLPDCEDNQLHVTRSCYGSQSQEQTGQKAGTKPVQFYKIG